MIGRALRKLAASVEQHRAEQARVQYAAALKAEHDARNALENARAELLDCTDKKLALSAWQKYRETLADLPKRTAERIEAHKALPSSARRPVL